MNQKIVFVAGTVLVAFVFLAVMNQLFNVPSAMPDRVTGAGVVGNSEVQVISLGTSGASYSPAVITVRENQPVRLVGDMTSLAGCSRAFRIPGLGLQKVFSQGDNVLEFTPTQKGSFPFSCSMGMYRGTLIVV